MVGLIRVSTCALIHPVGGRELIPTAVGIVWTIVKIAVAHPARLLRIPFRFTALVLSANIDPLLLFPCRQALGHIARQIGSVIATLADFWFALTTILCGNEHDARSSSSTIDGTGSSIFQYRDAFDIIGIEQRQIALHAVNQYEG